MKRLLSLTVLSCMTLIALQAQIEHTLMTVPEKTNYRETSSHQDVIDFINHVKGQSNLVHVESMLTSTEGRDVPLLVLSDPPLQSPIDAANSGKLVVYIQGNIHGGEVEGKEAVMILIREILFGDMGHLLDNQILLFAPIYNADGNDKMAADNRPSQEGSPELAGERRSGQDFDLNRDGMKMEAVETQGLINNVLLKWDPDVFVDLHTTNGTWHGNSLTYAPSYLHAGHPATSQYTMDVMLPAIQESVLGKYGLHFDIYGGYRLRSGWPPKALYTYNHHPRYLINQMGLRNRMGILSETFAHDPFYRRIFAAKAFVTEILEYTRRHAHGIRSINRLAERETIAEVQRLAGQIKKGVRFQMVPTEKPLQLRTYEYIPYRDEGGQVRYARSGEIVTVKDVANYNAFEPTLTSTLPRGYVIPQRFTEVVEKLRAHGVLVSEIDQQSDFTGEEFIIETYTLASRPFEGHKMASVEGYFQPAKKQFRAGDFLVDLAQPLATLIFYLLEPQSDDGLVTWNFFDDFIAASKPDENAVTYPIFKYW